MANATWSATDKSNITLSGGNLTAAFTITGNGAVRSSGRVSSGKYYWEYTATNWTGAPSVAVGIANTNADLTAGVASFTNASGILSSSGDIWLNGANAPGSPTLGARANGDIIGIALDADNKLIFYRVAPSGNWNGSAAYNPVTGAGGVDYHAISPDIRLLPVYALLRGAPGSSTSNVIANFGDSAFTGAVPAGFTPGLPDGGPAPVAVSSALARESLLATIPRAQVSAVAREILIANLTTATVSSIAREILLVGDPVMTPRVQTAIVMNMG